MNKLVVSFAIIFCVIACVERVGAQDVTQPHPGKKEVAVTGKLPVMYINTVDSVPITQKETYLEASYWIESNGYEGYENVGSESEPLALQIRGRGNSSWAYDKKPYKLKLGAKTALLGMPKHKHFALINHYPSAEFFANVICMEIGRLVGLPWNPRIRPVEVVLNGYNIGLYALTESVKIDKNRVNIWEQEDGNMDQSTVSGGWIVEIDNYEDEFQVKIMQDPMGEAFEKGFTHKTPEVLSDIQRDWLINELTSITNAIYVEDKTDNGWEEYINVESLINYYIVQELVGNLDAFIGSTYMYKNLGEKWEFGPLWDMGWSFSFEGEKRTQTFAQQRADICEYCPFTWITELWKFPSFRDAVYKRWKEIYPVKFSGLEDFMEKFIASTEEAYYKNYCEIWTGAPYFDYQYMLDEKKNKFAESAKWFDKYLTMASVTDIAADGDLVNDILVTKVSENLFSVQSKSGVPSQLSVFDVAGNEYRAFALGDGLFRVSVPTGLYIARALFPSGKSGVVKLRL